MAQQVIDCVLRRISAQANSRLAAQVLRDAVKRLGARGERCGCGDALRYAIITPIEAIPEETRSRLKPILGRYLKQG